MNPVIKEMFKTQRFKRMSFWLLINWASCIGTLFAPTMLSRVLFGIGLGSALARLAWEYSELRKYSKKVQSCCDEALELCHKAREAYIAGDEWRAKIWERRADVLLEETDKWWQLAIK